MSKDSNNQTSQPDIEELKESHTKIIQEQLAQENKTTEIINKTEKTHNEVYQYQSNSKLDKLPLWSKILIIIFLVLLCVGAIVGSVYAIITANHKLAN
ncbi:hypothetical protein [Mycoplasma sp. E35C]|uniref:hypothetical protein n=1 Tax=Mycoplasma sp. E35C TaxID=2801918 RepID=UPI001CA45FC6|nr:hypothetical protein [Mycoplasma sp. E35C]QZX48855.1 hypothetical protein JJE79_02225 [Mycoplasma sp. E35C]